MFDDNGDFGIKKTYSHNNKAVFGVSWSKFEASKFATGCDDGIVRVFDFADGFKEENVIKLEGHTKRVFNIVWHPHSENILASGSNDNTIKVWNIENRS